MAEELEQILFELGSDEARNKVISKLAGKMIIPEKLLVKAIEDYEKAGWFGDAADVAVRAGKTDRANKLRKLQELILS